ncbi:MAG: hypothetical protein VKP62_01240 [Candidatus Sericytochromatia bacterium]|nr:hypothetical protein [Candidatus Sericytochromatia bacterium]
MNQQEWIDQHGSEALREAFAHNRLAWQLGYREERAKLEYGPEFRIGDHDNRFTPAEQPSRFALAYAEQHGAEVATGYETVQIDPYSYIENGIGEVLLFRPPWLRDCAGSQAAVFARVAALQMQDGTDPRPG